MATKYRIAVYLLALCAPLGQNPTWADPAPPSPARPSGQVLVLDNERTLEGEMIRAGDQYRIRRTIGETWVPAAKVLCLCANHEEAYAYLRTRANLGDADERLRLARWCYVQGLREQALAEVTEAVTLRPTHEESQRLLRSLRRSAAAPAASEPAQSDSTPETAARLPALGEINPTALGLFVTRVQPILMNTCASCHATGRGGAFKILRAVEGGMANQRTTQQNLAAVLAQIDRDRPQDSPFLHKAVSIHGEAEKSPLKGRQTPAFQYLEEWVRSVAATPARADRASSPGTLPVKQASLDSALPLFPVQPRNPGGSSEDVPAPVAHVTPAPRTPQESSPFAQVVTVPQAPAPVPREPAGHPDLGTGMPIRPSVSSVAPARPAMPAAKPAESSDPFDPAIFNQEMHPEKKDADGKQAAAGRGE